VIPRKKLKASRDPEDNMVLECCLAAHAECLISGDKDLLTIETLSFPLAIMTPADFLAS
jgi:predicted nucleic acid-binding protein